MAFIESARQIGLLGVRWEVCLLSVPVGNCLDIRSLKPFSLSFATQQQQQKLKSKLQFEANITTLLLPRPVTLKAENTHLLCKGKYHCTADLLLDGCDSTKLVNLYLIQHKHTLNLNNINVRDVRKKEG